MASNGLVSSSSFPLNFIADGIVRRLTTTTMTRNFHHCRHTSFPKVIHLPRECKEATPAFLSAALHPPMSSRREAACYCHSLPSPQGPSIAKAITSSCATKRCGISCRLTSHGRDISFVALTPASCRQGRPDPTARPRPPRPRQVLLGLNVMAGVLRDNLMPNWEALEK